MEIKDVVQDIAAFKAAQMAAVESVKALAGQIEKGSKEGIAAATAKADAIVLQVTALADRLVAAEQKMLEKVMAGSAPAHSMGAFIVASNEFKAFSSGSQSRMRIDVKQGFNPQANTIAGQSGSPAANSDTLVQSDRMAGIVGGAFRALRVREVIPSGLTGSNLVEFTRELAFTNDAAETAEGATRPESDVTFELTNAPVVTIAHWIKLSKQVLSDAPALAAYIDQRLRYGVELRIDSQIINGLGTSQALKGLSHADNQTEFTPTSGDTQIDSVSRAKQALAVSDYPADAVILNTQDWGTIERLKDENLKYLVGNPFGAIVPTLWGLPVVVTNSISQGKILIGAFKVGAMLFEREGVTVEMSRDGNDFVKGLVTVQAEARLALAGLRPASILYGDLTV
jgi:HK97 family phage major capsid protein